MTKIIRLRLIKKILYLICWKMSITNLIMVGQVKKNKIKKKIKPKQQENNLKAPT